LKYSTKQLGKGLYNILYKIKRDNSIYNKELKDSERIALKWLENRNLGYTENNKTTFNSIDKLKIGTEAIKNGIEIKEVAKIKYEKAVEEKDEETAKKYAQMISRIEDYMIDDSKKLLDLLGIPWVEAPSEAEATAAHFTKIGKSDYTASQDYDSILFGAPNLIRNLTISGRRKVPRKNVYVNVDPEVIELKKLLEENNLSREQLIDIGILIGTDFNPNGIRGIGPVTAVKYIKKYGKLEHINELKEKIQEIEYEQIREIFLKPKITEPGDIKWNNIKKDKLVEFLCDEKGFSHDRIQNSLKKFEDAIKTRNQTLDKWFK